MADTKISALTELDAVPADGDWIPIVDVSDTSMAASGTTKKIAGDRFIYTNGTANTLAANLAANSKNITGAGTVSGTYISANATGNALNVGDDSNAESYANFASVRAFVGYDGSNAVLQGGVGKGVVFAVNDATYGSGTVAYFGTAGNFYHAGTINGNAAYFTGNIGLGTASPASQVHIVSASTGGAQFRVQNTDTGGKAYVFNSTGSLSTGGAGKFQIVESGSGNRITYDGTTGYLGIGSVNPSYSLDVNGQAHASSFPTSSDMRLKENIRRFNLTTPIKQQLNQINAYLFEWADNYNAVDLFRRSDGVTKDTQIGFIAQEVQAAVPQLVTTWRHAKETLDEVTGEPVETNIIEDALAVDYSRFVPILWEAAKELYTETASLRQRVAVLEAMVP